MTSGVTRLPFSELPFSPSPTHPLEAKKVVPGAGAALLRFAPGFADPNWCERSHVVYVLEGALELELPDRVERIQAGDGCWVERGSAHRARNPGAVDAVVFIVSDVAAHG